MKIQTKRTVTVYGTAGNLAVSTRYDDHLEIKVSYDDRSDTREATMVLAREDIQQVINALQMFIQDQKS